MVCKELSDCENKVFCFFQLRHVAAFGQSHPLDRTFDTIEEWLHHNVLGLIKLAVDEQGRDLNFAQFRLDVPCF